MKLRKLVGGAIGTAGLAAAGNALLSTLADDLEPPLPGIQYTYRWRGMDIAYTEAGDPTAPDVVLLHGISAASSSNEFVAIFEELSRDYHVIAPDLPGFGCSDRPALTYTADHYIDFIMDFVTEIADDPIGVTSSLSGAYAAAAQTRTDAFEKLVMVCPTATSMPGRRPLVRSLFRLPVVGQTLFNVLVSKPSIRYFNADHGYADMAAYDPERLEYQWQTSHQPGARFAPASFISGYLDPDLNLETTLRELDVPVTLVWGRDADITPLSVGEELAEASDGRLVVFDRSRLLPHDEHPEQFLDLLDEELVRPEH
ncbi:MAG: alpha/beta hydrolase [Halobacteriales archaeon]|nr:alpha/beta hydrolase [Halobacteriales archaeon]